MTRSVRVLLFVALGLVMFLAAGVGGSLAAPKKMVPALKFIISGHISGMEGSHSHATMNATANGKPWRTTTMKSDGSFTFRGMTPGSYTIRPTHRLYSFSPSFRTVAVRDHDVDGTDFRAREIPSRKTRR